MRELQALLKEVCEEVGDDVSFRNDYSGRGMYGRACVGIVGSAIRCQQIIGHVVKKMTVDLMYVNSRPDEEYAFDAAIDKLMDYKRDSLGLDEILYWPDLPSIEEENLEITLHDADLRED